MWASEDEVLASGDNGRIGVQRRRDRDTAGEAVARGPRQYTPQHSRRRTTQHLSASAIACAVLASSLPVSMAQSCISLANSEACPAFTAASVSTSSALVGLFPFLSDVTDTDSFDCGIRSYITGGFAQLR